MRGFFISRHRFEEVDEGLVFRCGTDAHPIQFVEVHGLEGARDFGQVLKEPPHDKGGGAAALGGQMRILRCWRSVMDKVMFFIGAGRHREFF